MNSYVGNTPTTGHFPTDTFTSSGGSTYTLSKAPATLGSIEVSVQGVLQAVSSYSISGTTLTLAGVTSGDVIFVRHLGETLLVPVPVDDSVTTAKIIDDAVTTAKILNANVTTAKIADNAITAAKIADGTVVAAEIASNAVTTAKIIDDAVTTAKILDANVTTAKIAADAIDGTKLADNACNSEHYTDGSIDLAHLSADCVDGTKIADDAVNSEHLVDGGVDNTHLATGISSSKLSGALPAISGAALTNLPFELIENNIAILGFKMATIGSLAKYNLVDQVVDEFVNNSGIDTSASSNENLSGGYYSGVTLGSETIWDYSVSGQNALINDVIGGSASGNAVPGDYGTGMAYQSGAPSWWSAFTTDVTPVTNAFYWAFSGNQTLGQVGFQTDFGSAKTWTKFEVGKANSHGDIKTWRIRYSLDGSSWTILDLSSGASSNTGRGTSNTPSGFCTLGSNGVNTWTELEPSDRTWASTISGFTAFSARYIRFEVGEIYSGQQNANHGMSRWLWYYQPSSAANLTLQSNSTTAQAVPTTADMVMLMEDGGGESTLNTDVKGYVSRDSGTTWTQGTLASEGLYGGGKKILTFHDLDISSQPSGTAMKYKITTHNQAAVTTGIQDISGTSKTISQAGSSSVTQSTAQAKWGTRSLYFDGTAKLSVTAHSDFDFGSNNATIEFWEWTTYFNTGVGDRVIGRGSHPAEWFYRSYFAQTSQSFKSYIGGGNQSGGSGPQHGATNSSWTHVAIVREGTAIRVYVGGVQRYSATVSGSWTVTNTNNALGIGGGIDAGQSEYYTGYLQDIRISNTARYTGGNTFSVPTAAFTTDSNTKLLINGNDTGKDTRIHAVSLAWK